MTTDLSEDEDVDMISEPSSEEGDDGMFDFFSGTLGRANTGDIIAGSMVNPATFGTPGDSSEWQRVSLLGPEDIRIFSIDPAKFETEGIHCTFRRTTLTAPEPYFALSYAWGESFADGSHLTDTIYCDESPVKVTSTLHQALKRIREMQYTDDEEKRLAVPALWVDAICIDQANVIERGLQVMLMGKIYGWARHLIVWLGEPDEMLPYGDFVRDKETDDLCPLSAPDAGFDYSPALGRALRSRSFFHRRWILQETFLSSLQSILVGSHRLFVTNLPECLWDQSCALALYDPFRDKERFVPKNTIKSDIKKGCLMQHLVDFDTFECSDGRDRVYALRDISCDGHHLKIDYRMNTAELYMSLAIHWIRSGHLMPVLVCAVQRPRDLDWYSWSDDAAIPFWVPDWRIPLSTSQALTKGSLRPYNVQEDQEEPPIQWPSDHEPIYSSSPDDKGIITTRSKLRATSAPKPYSSATLKSLETTAPLRGVHITHPALPKPILCLALPGIVIRRCNLHHGSREMQKSSGLQACSWCFFSKSAPLGYMTDSERQFVFGKSRVFNEVFCVLESGWILGLQPSPYEDSELGRKIFRVRTIYTTKNLRFENDLWIGGDEEYPADVFDFQEILIC